MALNTLKTTFGFLRTLVGKYTPIESSSDSLQDIFNYLEISECISTSGQPTENQFSLVKAAGFENVINLAPHNVENSLANEAGVLSTLGMNYIHIPVDCGNPTEDNFNEFSGALKSFENQKVWVHCAANMRVSAFVYRYRCNVLGEQSSSARKDLSKIWEPFGVWKDFTTIIKG